MPIKETLMMSMGRSILSSAANWEDRSSVVEQNGMVHRGVI